ncbi:glycoside hydrolase family 10 protein [Deinococcus sp. QL22]|uniref:glycoside hydrolase family 10 protein n=1 Tax=Deinococcus sp. QL22 TaxID=2939437 RepID=UPI00201831AF|nr:family 10 glycosylhydrolase [Deinococcus sp. QL22]
MTESPVDAALKVDAPREPVQRAEQTLETPPEEQPTRVQVSERAQPAAPLAEAARESQNQPVLTPEASPAQQPTQPEPTPPPPRAQAAAAPPVEPRLEGKPDVQQAPEPEIRVTPAPVPPQPRPAPPQAPEPRPVSKPVPRPQLEIKSAPVRPLEAKPAVEPKTLKPAEAAPAVALKPAQPAAIQEEPQPASLPKPEPRPEPPPVVGPLQSDPALRGLWVDAFGPGFKTPGEVDRLIQDARAMNINTLFVQAVKRGDCYCDNSLFPRTEDPAVPAGFDPLADVLAKAGAQGIRVHAWVIPTAVANRAVRYPVTHPQHVVNAHGEGTEQDWLTRNAAGAVWAGNDQQLDLGNPEARAYVVEGVRSLTAAYGVDGVQLDRVRYPDPSGAVQDWGYNAGAVAAYQAETGTAEMPAPADARWITWRRERVNALVSEVAQAVRGARAGAVMSVAAITYGAGPGSRDAFTRTRTYSEVLQDWPSWLASGQVDLVVMMNYKREARADQARDFDTWNRFAASVKGRGQVAAGTALYLNTAAENLAQARRVVELGMDGWVGYSYRTPELGVEEGRKAGDQAFRELSSLLVGEKP